MSRIVRVLLFVAAAVAALILAAAVALFTLLDTKSVEAAFSRLTHDAFGTDVSDAAIRRELADIPCTKIIATQRVSSVMQADCIIVLDNGRIAASGTHEELLARCPLYREISLSQIGGAALE